RGEGQNDQVRVRGIKIPQEDWLAVPFAALRRGIDTVQIAALQKGDGAQVRLREVIVGRALDRVEEIPAVRQTENESDRRQKSPESRYLLFIRRRCFAAIHHNACLGMVHAD